MNLPAMLLENAPLTSAPAPQPSMRPRHRKGNPLPFRFTAQMANEHYAQHDAELFYLQKQIHAQTPMVIVLEDGEQITGCIEWYDRNAIKVRGRTRTLIYKSAIKYMYKVGDSGS